MLRWFFAIAGMAAVGMLVWRMLQRQEQADTRPEDDRRERPRS